MVGGRVGGGGGCAEDFMFAIVIPVAAVDCVVGLAWTDGSGDDADGGGVPDEAIESAESTGSSDGGESRNTQLGCRAKQAMLWRPIAAVRGRLVAVYAWLMPSVSSDATKNECVTARG
jgi:hypothetical protein